MPLKKLATLFASLWKWGHPKDAPPKLTFEFKKVSEDGLGYQTMEEVPAAKVGAPVRVASGSFRVDWERAFEKLQKFQLGNAEEFLVPLLRCAVAGGAKRIEAGREGDALWLGFDGQPLKRSQVQDPFAALFEADARGRQLAYGLLAALRLEPEWVSLESGRAGDRVRLAAGHAPTLKSPGDATAIAVGFKAKRAAPFERALNLLRGAAGFHDGELLVRGERVDGASFGGTRFEYGSGAGQVKGFQRILPDSAESLLSLYTYGAHACDLKHKLPMPGQFRVHLRCDALNLDLSQTKVVEDAALRRTLDIVTTETWRSIKSLAGKADPGKADWLREVVVNALDGQSDMDRPQPGSLIDQLWEAPVFASKRGDKLSLARISQAVSIWGPDLVLGGDAAIPAVHVRFRNEKERKAVRALFGLK